MVGSSDSRMWRSNEETRHCADVQQTKTNRSKGLCNTEQHGKSNIGGTSQRTFLEDSENKRRKLTTTKVTSKKVDKQSSNSNRSTEDSSAKIERNSGRRGDLRGLGADKGESPMRGQRQNYIQKGSTRKREENNSGNNPKIVPTVYRQVAGYREHRYCKTAVQKQGEKRDTKYYRRISLLSMATRILARIITLRLRE